MEKKTHTIIRFVFLYILLFASVGLFVWSSSHLVIAISKVIAHGYESYPTYPLFADPPSMFSYPDQNSSPAQKAVTEEYNVAFKKYLDAKNIATKQYDEMNTRYQKIQAKTVMYTDFAWYGSLLIIGMLLGAVTTRSLKKETVELS